MLAFSTTLRIHPWRLILGLFCVQLVSIVGAFGAPSMSDDQPNYGPIDAAFLSVITSLGADRQRNHAAGYEVTDAFKPIFDQFSVSALHDYISSKYGLKKGNDQFGNYETTDIQYDELRKLDRRFLRCDKIFFSFRYDENWSRISEFSAGLMNCIA